VESDVGLEVANGDDAQEVGSGSDPGEERRDEREWETWDVGYFRCRYCFLLVGSENESGRVEECHQSGGIAVENRNENDEGVNRHSATISGEIAPARETSIVHSSGMYSSAHIDHAPRPDVSTVVRATARPYACAPSSSPSSTACAPPYPWVYPPQSQHVPS